MLRLFGPLLFLLHAVPLHAMDIVHGNTAIPPVHVRTEHALAVAGEHAAALGWMQMYVYHPASGERETLLRSGRQVGAMGILPAGSELRLLAIARNRGALMAEILILGNGDTTAPARGCAADRPLPAADASYPFAIPPRPAPHERLCLQTGARICFDTAEALTAAPALRPLLSPEP